ncbi:hypothetical protein FRC00_011154 [Tulasnella sp. 408]|nr:hypothetical protein FRC00_011154 [Tulasnella sp. 408]
MKPPAMVLDDQVNGFRVANGKVGGGGKKFVGKESSDVELSKPSLGIGQAQFHPNVWDPMEMYDPTRLNHYAKFKAWKHREKTENQMRKKEAEAYQRRNSVRTRP